MTKRQGRHRNAEDIEDGTIVSKEQVIGHEKSRVITNKKHQAREKGEHCIKDVKCNFY